MEEAITSPCNLHDRVKLSPTSLNVSDGSSRNPFTITVYSSLMICDGFISPVSAYVPRIGMWH